MKTNIFYFTGTGNSLKLTQDLALELGNTILTPIAGLQNGPINLEESVDCIGLIPSISNSH